MQKFGDLTRGNELIAAPVALNPIMARLAEEAGFKALYLRKHVARPAERFLAIAGPSAQGGRKERLHPT
jgi:hypothetical protein